MGMGVSSGEKDEVARAWVSWEPKFILGSGKRAWEGGGETRFSDLPGKSVQLWLFVNCKYLPY